MKSVQNQAVMQQKTVKNVIKCEIDWATAPEHCFTTYAAQVKRLNLLQSLDYVQAICMLRRQQYRVGLIKVNGMPAGLVTIIEVGVMKNALHAVMIDRGPVWLSGYGHQEHFKAFAVALREAFPKRIGRRMRFIPECGGDPQMVKFLTALGFVSKSVPYKTIWLDMRLSLEDLRADQKGRWRNALSKGEKSDLEIVLSDEGKHFSWAMLGYEKDKKEKGYPGADMKTIVAMAKQFSRGKNMIVATALFDAKPIASIVIFIHGRSATYQIGYTTKTGREKCAHHLLLWETVKRLKERKIDDFDLGGINDEDAKGVRDFKRGLGGEEIETPGLFT